MRDFVYGKDVIIEAYKENNYYPFACAEEVSIRMSSELISSTTADSGAWEYPEYAGRNSWEVDMSGVTVLKDELETLWFAWELFKEQIRTEGFDLRIRFIDKNGFEMYVAGHVKIPVSEINGRADDFSRFSWKGVGSGPLNINEFLTPPINPNVKRIPWIATGAEPNIVQSNFLIGKTIAEILQVSWEGDDKFEVIDAGDPTAKQVRLDGSAGTLRFLNDFDPGDYIYAIIIND